jgi:hypothetical protein
MGKSKRDKKKDAMKNKVVTMPQRSGGKDTEETEEDEKKKPAKKGLRGTAKKIVTEDSGEFVLRLTERAKQGDVQSAEVVVALMEKRKKEGGEGDGPDEPSLAEQLMAGPTWEEVLEARRKAKEEEDEAGKQLPAASL